jgi:WD40 repeat protein
LAGRTDAVRAIAFSPTRPLLASASSDRGVRVWELNVDQVIASFCHGALAEVKQQAPGTTARDLPHPRVRPVSILAT